MIRTVDPTSTGEPPQPRTRHALSRAQSRASSRARSRARVGAPSRAQSCAHSLARSGARSPLRRCLRVCSALTAVLVATAAALVAVLAVATHLSPQGQYGAFGHPVLTVLSGSMTPVIRTGDLIVDDPVTPAQARRLRPGEIISFRAAPGSPVIITHRIVQRQVDRGIVNYVTKGDANNAPDAILRPAADVVGVFHYSIRDGGYILSALHRPLVVVMFLASILFWLLAGPFYRLAANLDKRQHGQI
jgi:signal peptidase